jgi:phosphoribosylglycinamide formyltransferase-1
MLRCAVLVSGRGSNMEALFRAKAQSQLPVEFVLVATDQPGAPAIAKAQAFGVPVWEAAPAQVGGKAAYFAQLTDALHQASTELVLLAGFMRILPFELLNRYPNAVLNIHPALLPSFPGMHAQTQAIEAGVRFSGFTVHFVDSGVDTGPIIDQAVVPVLSDDTADTLAQRILQEEHRLYPACVRLYAEGRLKVDGRRVTILPQAPTPRLTPSP